MHTHLTLGVRLGALLAALALSAPAARAGEEGRTMKVVVHPALLSSKPTTFRVKLEASALAALKTSKAALLKLDGIESGSQTGLLLRVFIAAPEASLSTSTDDKRFLGNVTLVAAGKTAKGKKTHEASAVLELSPEAKAQTLAAGELAVTLVPTDVDGKEPASAGYSIKKISLDL